MPGVRVKGCTSIVVLVATSRQLLRNLRAFFELAGTARGLTYFSGRKCAAGDAYGNTQKQDASLYTKLDGGTASEERHDCLPPYQKC